MSLKCCRDDVRDIMHSSRFGVQTIRHSVWRCYGLNVICVDLLLALNSAQTLKCVLKVHWRGCFASLGLKVHAKKLSLWLPPPSPPPPLTSFPCPHPPLSPRPSPVHSFLHSPYALEKEINLQINAQKDTSYIYINNICVIVFFCAFLVATSS